MDIFSKIPYNTYRKIDDINEGIVVSTQLSALLNLLTINDSSITKIMLGIGFPLAAICIFNDCNNSVSKTKEIVYIRNLYNEFIKEYNKLNKMFNLNNPNSLFAMFTFLLHNGYLSKDKIFIHDSSNSFDIITNLLGVNVMTGKAVCRHTSFLFKDIINNFGENSSAISVFSSPNLNVFNNTWTNERDEEKYKKFLQETEGKTSIYEALKKLFQNNYYLIDQFDDVEYANHMITGVFKDEKAYFFDPTNDVIAKRMGGFLIDNIGNVMLICKGKTKVYNNKKEKEALKTNIVLPNTTFEEDYVLINDMKKVLRENIDILETFYRQHHELYEEIDNTLSKITKPKSKRLIK